MGFWERVKKDLQLAMQEGVDLVREGTATLETQAKRVAKKGAASLESETRRLTRLGKVRYELYQLNRKSQTKFTEIGGRAYDLASNDLRELKIDENLRKLILDTREIEQQVRILEAEVSKFSARKKKEAA